MSQKRGGYIVAEQEHSQLNRAVGNYMSCGIEICLYRFLAVLLHCKYVLNRSPAANRCARP